MNEFPDCDCGIEIDGFQPLGYIRKTPLRRSARSVMGGWSGAGQERRIEYRNLQLGGNAGARRIEARG